MKHFAFCLFALLFSVPAFSQENQTIDYADSLVLDALQIINGNVEKPCYKMYSTQNANILLRLNTVTGEVAMVQYRLGSQDSAIVAVSDGRILSQYQDAIPGRYILVPTQNMYNFILLDQIDGYVFQAQWSFTKEKRFVEYIGKYAF